MGKPARPCRLQVEHGSSCPLAVRPEHELASDCLQCPAVVAYTQGGTSTEGVASVGLINPQSSLTGLPSALLQALSHQGLSPTPEITTC